MALEAPVVQTTREAPSTPMRETFIAPKILAVCCVCGLIRDESGCFRDHERWVTPRTYRTTHDLNPADFPLTHGYCPKCFTRAMDVNREILTNQWLGPVPTRGTEDSCTKFDFPQPVKSGVIEVRMPKTEEAKKNAITVKIECLRVT